MKRKSKFFKRCFIGFIVVLVFLVGTLFISSQNSIYGSVNLIALISPLLFIPLLIYVLQDKGISCSDGNNKSKKVIKIGLYEQNTCILSVGSMLIFILIVSMFVLYYGW